MLARVIPFVAAMLWAVSSRSASAQMDCTFDGPTSNATRFVYSLCDELGGIGFGLYWRFNATHIDIALRRQKRDDTTDYWLGFGFSDGGDRPMIGSNAVIGGTILTPQVAGHILNAKSTTGVPVDPAFVISNPISFVDANNNAVMGFTRALHIPSIRDVYVDGTFTNIIFAMGTIDPGTGSLKPHGGSNKAFGSINFQTGAIVVETNTLKEWKNAHAALMGIAFAILLPAGTFAARFFKRYDPEWFHFHRLFQISALLCWTAGYIIGIGKIGSGTFVTHLTIGTVIVALGWAQPFIAAFRKCKFVGPPNSGDRNRLIWEFVHKNIGRSILILSIIQINIGLTIYFEGAKGNGEVTWRVVYIVGIVLMIMIGIGMEVQRRKQEAALMVNAAAMAIPVAGKTSAAAAASNAAAGTSDEAKQPLRTSMKGGDIYTKISDQ